ncbi:MAG: flagellar biosynthetic protein FliR [Acidimicrobiales bacterium]
MFEDPALFALALGRASGWVATVPIFGPVRTTAIGRIGLAVAIAMFVSGSMPPTDVPSELGPIGVVLAGQVLYGMLLGWITSLVISAFEAAGGTIDLVGGLSAGAVLDPSTGTSNATVARLFQMTFVAVLVITNAHLLIVGGFVRSFARVPATTIPVIGEDDLSAIVRAAADLLLASLEIGAPVVGVLILAEVAMALAARFAPQANIFMLSLPLKAMIVLVLLANVLLFLPVFTERITEEAATLLVRVG